MERSTTGRRHQRAGAVTVAELIRKQPIPPRYPSTDSTGGYHFRSEVFERVASGATSPQPVYSFDPDPDPEPEEGEHPLLKPLRTVGLVFGALLLAGSVVAASVITADYGPRGPRVQYQAPQLNGVLALRPDLLLDRLTHSTKVNAALGAPGARNPSTSNKNVTPVAKQKSTWQPNAVTPTSAVEVVQEFFQRLQHRPDLALQMVDTRLIGPDRAAFLKAWETVKSVQVKNVEQNRNGVLGTTTLELVNGTKLRMEQLLTLSVAEPRQIVAAELLSVQQS
ncbi:hypothetical protein NLX83_05960 [Allokutzneria sp. A3M-2-11 16]|uniref:hypothetical protein n=1 Tax=Allokutzneria sp. A3M-2-11 16 TaxID=2962043 RepID=UPI0020B78331|nr:hypothetical protein [Allokutzneria sp. A3M-2-11 16]MCP3798796.1 hypothetical protein [Allokutzneria sp. A3M-2-11 16]